MKNSYSIFLLSFLMNVHVAQAQFIKEMPRLNAPDIPVEFRTPFQTEELQWGCEVNDRVEADSKEKAIDLIGKQCVDTVEEAAAARPGVLQVYMKSLEKTNLTIERQKSRFTIKGTIFIHTWAMLARSRVLQ